MGPISSECGAIPVSGGFRLGDAAGPAAYNRQDVNLRSSPAFSMKSRTNIKTSNMDAPGPGSYSIPDTIAKSPGKSMGSRTQFGSPLTVTDSPGPGQVSSTLTRRSLFTEFLPWSSFCLHGHERRHVHGCCNRNGVLHQHVRNTNTHAWCLRTHSTCPITTQKPLLQGILWGPGDVKNDGMAPPARDSTLHPPPVTRQRIQWAVE